MIHDGDEVFSDTTRSKTNWTILTRAQLIEDVSRAVEVSSQRAADIVEAILNSMVGALQRGDRVEIRGFGSFDTRQRAARIGRNPKTGARVEVLPKKVPYFKPSKEVRDRLEKISTGQVLGGMDKTKTPPL